jgi:hypothetical protein
MDALTEAGDPALPDVTSYKRMIAKAIIFKAAHRLTRPFPQVQAQLAAYVTALLALKYGSAISLDMIWQQQGISPALEGLISTWLTKIYEMVRETGGERLPSEWVKKAECWTYVRNGAFPPPSTAIRELQQAV